MNERKEISRLDSLTHSKLKLTTMLNRVYRDILDEEYDEALYEIEKISKRFPNIVDIYHLKFKIYCIKEKYKLAEKIICEAEEIFKDNEKIKADRKFINEINENIKNTYLASEDYLKLYELADEETKNDVNKENIMSSYYYRALSYRMLDGENKNKYYNEACKVYNNIRKEDSENLQAYLYNALCYKDLKEYGEALKMVNYVLSKDKNNNEAIKIKISIIKELSHKK